MRPITLRPAAALPLLLLALAACERASRSGATRDSAIAMVPDSAAVARTGAAAAAAAPSDSALALPDSIAGVPGVPGVPGVQAPATAASDSARATVVPADPRRGGVIWVFVSGPGSETPSCTWKGERLPCYRDTGGVRAIIPLPADAPAGTFTLTVDGAGPRLSRQVTVADQDFGRQLVFLDRERYALLGKRADLARDARALRQVLNAESPGQAWSGRWRAMPGERGAGYGEERFYYLASDSSRAIRLDPALRARGVFASDTSSAAPAAGAANVPSWRHAGVDIRLGKGTALRAPAAGTVADVGEYTLTGRTLIVDHGQGVMSAYFHLDTALVRRGDVVRAGAAIARVGSTGLSTGPHLHYGIYVHGSDVDPVAWHDMPASARGDSASRRAQRDSARP
ncbi:MAG: M23 family metallopeptidase [Gemmatimonadaceae bacterium]